jgi:phosphoribosylformylglycinamidine synthase
VVAYSDNASIMEGHVVQRFTAQFEAKKCLLALHSTSVPSYQIE